MFTNTIIVTAFTALLLSPDPVIEQTPIIQSSLPTQRLQIVQQTALAPVLNPETLLYTSLPENQRVRLKKRRVVVTAYSSTPDQTDSTPFITAIGTTVRDGIIAANWLPIGAYVRLPEIYGEKVFVVEDRMHPKNAHKIDIWMNTREEAKEFGVRRLLADVF